MIARFYVLCALIFFLFSSSDASATNSVVIPSAYVQIAEENRVPPEILFVVSLGESGTKLTSGRVLPWPWTLNIAGKGHFYRTRVEAYTNLMAAIQAGHLVDIGLGQVNWQSHAKSLNSDPWFALEPYNNLRVAARLLRTLYDANGNADWWAAVGDYHSPGRKADQRIRAMNYSANAKARYNRLFRNSVVNTMAENNTAMNL